MKTDAERKAEALRAEWVHVFAKKLSYFTEELATAEQDAWDALIDHVEESGLNGTVYDPR